MKKKRNPVKESFSAFKLSKPTEQLLREVDEEERKIEYFYSQLFSYKNEQFCFDLFHV